MMRKLLNLLGYEITYVCEWGTYLHRYDGIDRHMCRPIHKKMSVAPPWAKLQIRRIKDEGGAA